METTWDGIDDVLTKPLSEVERDDASRTSPRFIVNAVLAEESDDVPLPPQFMFTVSNASSAIINIFFMVNPYYYGKITSISTGVVAGVGGCWSTTGGDCGGSMPAGSINICSGLTVAFAGPGIDTS